MTKKRRFLAASGQRVKMAYMLPLALAACNHPQPGIQVQTVEVPVPQPCLAAEDIPPEPPQVGEQLTGNAASDLLIVAASALDLRAWGITLQAALKACAE